MQRTNIPGKRRRFRFNRWWLIGSAALILVGLAWALRECNGHVVLEGEVSLAYAFRPGHFIEVSGDDDRKALESAIRAEFEHVAEKHNCTPWPVRFESLDAETSQHLRIRYEKWVRHFFDIRYWGYLVDDNDPTAMKRNADLERRIAAVIKAHRDSRARRIVAADIRPVVAVRLPPEIRPTGDRVLTELEPPSPDGDEGSVVNKSTFPTQSGSRTRYRAHLPTHRPKGKAKLLLSRSN